MILKSPIIFPKIVTEQNDEKITPVYEYMLTLLAGAFLYPYVKNIWLNPAKTPMQNRRRASLKSGKTKFIIINGSEQSVEKSEKKKTMV